MRSKIILVVAILFMATGQGFGETYFNDGGTHNIDYTLADRVQVRNGPSNMPTTVNLLNGGIISGTRLVALEDSLINIYGGSVSRVAAADNSQVTMSNGSVGGYLSATDNAQITMSGGSAAYLQAWGNGQVTMSGGSADSFTAYDSGSHITMSGGSVIGDLYVSGQATMSNGSVGGRLYAAGLVNLSGGSVGGNLEAFTTCLVNWSGGTLAGDIVLDSQSILSIDGTNFAIDGSPVDFGEITSILGGWWEDEPYRLLTGTLANGDIINNQFQIGNDAQIVLVPEPATLLLLGLGGLAIRKRK